MGFWIFCQNIIFDQKLSFELFSDPKFFSFNKIFLLILFLIKNFYPNIFWPKDYFAQKVFIAWQNCCDKFNLELFALNKHGISEGIKNGSVIFWHFHKRNLSWNYELLLRVTRQSFWKHLGLCITDNWGSMKRLKPISEVLIFSRKKSLITFITMIKNSKAFLFQRIWNFPHLEIKKGIKNCLVFFGIFANVMWIYLWLLLKTF